MNLPILEAWLRFGTRGDDLRWERVHLTVLHSVQYKLILGMDILQPRKARMDVERCTLSMEKRGITYTLPLKDKQYAYRATSIQQYLQAQRIDAASEENSGDREEADLSREAELAMMEQVEERWMNALDHGELQYVA